MIVHVVNEFQSPHGDFGVLNRDCTRSAASAFAYVSIPSRGFWCFELLCTATDRYRRPHFNPLTGILVF